MIPGAARVFRSATATCKTTPSCLPPVLVTAAPEAVRAAEVEAATARVRLAVEAARVVATVANVVAAMAVMAAFRAAGAAAGAAVTKALAEAVMVVMGWSVSRTKYRVKRSHASPSSFETA